MIFITDLIYLCNYLQKLFDRYGSQVAPAGVDKRFKILFKKFD